MGTSDSKPGGYSGIAPRPQQYGAQQQAAGYPAYPHRPAGGAPPPLGFGPPPTAPAGAPGPLTHGILTQSPTMRFRAIADGYSRLDQVQEALRREGLESSNLIVAVDFTKSNEWTGKRSFGGRSLHAIGPTPSPYEEAIAIIGRTLAAFDDDGLIPCYGFGDTTTGDQSVFSFNAGDQPCHGLDSVVWRYRELCPYVRMAGPTSFGPAIRQACRIVSASGSQYHILLIVADGQVTRPSGVAPGELSAQERDTVDALVAASNLPLSIVMIGVGDGPWDLMKEFDDALPTRQFDNFQFVNWTDLSASMPGGDPTRREAQFALRALMEIPEQFKEIQKLGLLGRRQPGNVSLPGNPPLDPPAPQGMAPPPPHAPYGMGASAPPLPPYGAAPPGKTTSAPGTAPPLPAGLQQAYASQPSMSSASAAPPLGGQAGGAGASSSNAGAQGAAGPVYTAQSDALFVCPITQEVMADPVLAADGYTYDRSAIAAWLERHDTSPMTNARLEHKTLIPNHALRSAIREWQERTSGSGGGGGHALASKP